MDIPMDPISGSLGTGVDVASEVIFSMFVAIVAAGVYFAFLYEGENEEQTLEQAEQEHARIGEALAAAIASEDYAAAARLKEQKVRTGEALAWHRERKEAADTARAK